jgi:hypothetical protein
MPEPSIQIVTVVGARSAVDEWDRIEAIEIAFGPDDGISPEALIDGVIDLIRPRSFSLEERYGKFSRGAAGPDIQTLLVITAAGGAAGALARDVIIAGLKSLSKRLSRLASDTDSSDEPPWAGEYRGTPRSAEIAWSMFADAVERAFQTTRLRATSVERHPEGWHIVADSNQGAIEGNLTFDGCVVSMRKSDISY